MMIGLNVSSHLFLESEEANYAILRGMAESPALAHGYSSGSGEAPPIALGSPSTTAKIEF